MDASEIKKLYTQKMVPKKQPGRHYYDKILNLAQYETCPFCGQRNAETIDHYLPKDNYPQFSISPINLIPACRDCNSKKGEKGFKNDFEAVIHPYFDEIDNEKWLFCKVVESDPISFTFYVSPPLCWDELLNKRIQYHFEQLQLNKLYTAHASREFNNIRGMLIREYSLNGSDGVRYFLDELILSEECNVLNSWRLAMFRSLKENKWFFEKWFTIENKIKKSI